MPFPTNLFVSGHANPAVWQPFGSSQQYVLNITGWTGDEEINVLDVTHSGLGGLRGRLANVLDFQTVVGADYDLLAPPYLDPPSIKPGFNGNMFLFVSPTNFFQFPGMICKLHWESQVLGKVSYNFDFKLNAIVGPYVRPTH